MTDLFWKVAESDFALSIDAAVLLSALLVGFVPLVKYLPVVGPYVPTARLVSVLVALLIAFMLGARVADEREAVGRLRTKLEAANADLDAATKSAADERQRASEIEAAANAQRETDAEYIRQLESAPACAFEPGVGRLRFFVPSR